MRKKFLIGAGAAALLAGGAGGLAIAGGGFPGEKRLVAERVEVESIVARDKGPVLRGSKGGPKISFFFARTATVPEEGSGRLVEIKCPRNEGAAINGGARTSEGIVLGYLSKGSPEGDLSARTFYVGVDDASSTNEVGAGAFVEVQCAKGIKLG